MHMYARFEHLAYADGVRDDKRGARMQLHWHPSDRPTTIQTCVILRPTTPITPLGGGGGRMCIFLFCSSIT